MQLTTVQGRFVGPLPSTFAPAHATAGPGQAGVFDHTLHRQVLNADGLVFATQPGGQLVQGIGPRLGGRVQGNCVG